MLFNSYFFIFVFLPAVLVMWWCARLSTKHRLIAMVAASYCFYGWWDYRFVGLLAFSSLVDYFVGGRMAKSRSSIARRAWLLTSLSTNLGMLAYFKYRGFFAESMNMVGEWLRTGGDIPVPEIILPVGISFYTFQTLSYTIDIYRGTAKPTKSFWHFAAYVSLFPQLVAGPIVRYSELESQLRELTPKVDWQRFSRGLLFFVAGLAQKILLADTIAGKINPMFAMAGDFQFASSWFAMLGYTFQLYFDFAGYSNMAVGLGLMLGFSFPQNFDSPYKAQNISLFWRKWHMTLSGFLRDYLFVPLGGSRGSGLITLRNLFIVMFLGGLWHGAGWTFVLWGVYHGALLIIHNLAKREVEFPRIVSMAMTFVAVVFGWVLFRSSDLEMCGNILQAMVGLKGLEANALAAIGGVKSAVILAFLGAIVFFAPNLWQLRLRLSYPLAIGMAMLFVVCVLRFDAESPFLYFQF